MNAAIARWQEEQRRLDYRACIAAGFIYKSEKESYTMAELFPSLAQKKSDAEQIEESVIEAFKAIFGYPGQGE